VFAQIGFGNMAHELDYAIPERDFEMLNAEMPMLRSIQAIPCWDSLGSPSGDIPAN